MAGNENSERVILVTGATGHQGGAVARHLLRLGFPIRTLTRDPNKPEARELANAGANIVQGNLDDPGSVRRAIAGAYGVFSVQNFWETGYDREVQQGKTLADIAKEAGVQHFVYSSVGSANRNTGLAHFESKWEIEQHIRAIGIPYTIFRPVYFMQNWKSMQDSILNGSLITPMDPDKRLQQINVDDIGAFVAMAFDDPGSWNGRELDLAGDEPTMTETAGIFGRALGRVVAYTQIPWEQFEAMAGEEYTKMFRWFQDYGYSADIPALRREYPRLATLEETVVRENWFAAVPAGV